MLCWCGVIEVRMKSPTMLELHTMEKCFAKLEKKYERAGPAKRVRIMKSAMALDRKIKLFRSVLCVTPVSVDAKPASLTDALDSTENTGQDAAMNAS